MEEKILAKLEQLDTKFDQFEIKIDQKLDEMKETLRNEFKQENKKLKEELRNEFMEENEKLKEEVSKEIGKQVRRQILDHMFVFEENYGRRLNIAFEEMMCRSHKEDIQDENIKNLERRTDMNSAFVFHHEDRLEALETAQL